MPVPNNLKLIEQYDSKFILKLIEKYDSKFIENIDKCQYQATSN